jgi:hypothetical protein
MPQLADPIRLIRTEDQESYAFAQLLLLYQRMGKVHVYSHIHHEAHAASWSGRLKKKRLGTRRGVPDYIIVINGKVLFIEMKRVKDGVVSPEQKEWLIALDGKTTRATVCKGYDEAKAFLDKELGVTA